MDSGSTHSFLAKVWADVLHLKKRKSCKVTISTFKNSPKTQLGTLVEASVSRNLITPYTFKLDFIALNDFRLEIPSFKLTNNQKQAIEDSGLILADPEASEEGGLIVEALLGQDFPKI